MLRPEQRRFVYAAVRRAIGRAYNGEPFILDDLIEEVKPIQMSQQEIGWDKSEDKVRGRILAAFATNPFILGAMAPSSYAQAYIVKELWGDRANVFVDMLSTLLTTMVARFGGDDKLMVWLEKIESKDPQLESKEWIEARKGGDVTKNENRARLGLPMLEEDEEKRSKLFETVGGVTAALALFQAVGKGETTPQIAAWLYEQFFGTPKEDVLENIGQSEVDVAREELQDALEEYRHTPRWVAGLIVDETKGERV